ncbi:hypothetical protein V6N11_030566 [Hibiscus sabdariffa]|uniref:RING-type E3 ubiquitin transferase n=1 Tax=Hibiscus sabdariffa TaxID=183260 RepID=A0ABR1ZTN4_9ROSI
MSRQSLREAARFLRRASSRRLMREPSMLVRETAAEQLEERHSDWAYSKPVVVLDIIWNFAFVAVAVGVLVLSGGGGNGTLSPDDGGSVAKHLESANTMFSFVWWIIGFYWLSVGGQAMARNSPQLYWLCIVFLGFDVFFVVFCGCTGMCNWHCCLLLPSMYYCNPICRGRSGRSFKEDIDQLPRYKFRKIGNVEKCACDVQGPVGV